jgi:hypothetical protein
MNKRWITGKELMESMDLTQRELYEFFILGLPVYDGAGRFIINSMNPKTPRAIMGLGAVYVNTGSNHFIDMMRYKKFKIDEVRGFLEEQGLMHLIPEPGVYSVDQCEHHHDKTKTAGSPPDYSYKSESEKRELAIRWKAEGQTRHEIGLKLFPEYARRIDAGEIKKESLKKQVSRLINS